MMRLIDVDEAIEKINGLCVDGNKNWIGTENQSFIDHADVIDILSSIPTVDAVPVVHGRWIKDGDYFVCSECGEEHAWADYRATYCEDCGAKMEKKAERREEREGITPECRRPVESGD